MNWRFAIFMFTEGVLVACLILIVCMFGKTTATSPTNWFIRLSKKKIHRDEYGILYHAFGLYGTMAFVRVEDTTGVHWILVPITMRTAKEAVAWSYYKTPEDFDPERV